MAFLSFPGRVPDSVAGIWTRGAPGWDRLADLE